jgi:hypothetical protein
MRLSQDIQVQASLLDIRRQALAGSFNKLKTRYRRRLSSPTAFLSLFTAGLITGLLSRGKSGRDRSRTRSATSMMRWLALARSMGGPALIYLLRAKLGQMMEKAKP